MKKICQTRGKILWYGGANIRIREEAVGEISSFSWTSHRNRWHFHQVEKKNKEKCSEVLNNKIIKKEAFQQWMLHELHQVAFYLIGTLSVPIK